MLFAAETDPFVTIAVAFIGFSGAVLAAWLVARASIKNTQTMAAAETERQAYRVQAELRARLNEKKLEWIRRAISELLAITDPDFEPTNYKRVTTLIHKIQMTLDLRREGDRQVNHFTTALGLAVREYARGEHAHDDLSRAHAGLIDAARLFFAQASG